MSDNSETPGWFPAWLVRPALYVGGPFFCYPHKPFVNLALCTYKSAYGNFRRDHASAANLTLHSAALVGQIAANFALLNEIDQLPWFSLLDSPVSRATALAWAGSLAIQSDSPLHVRAAAMAGIGLGWSFRGECGELLFGAASTYATAAFESVLIHVDFRKKRLTDWTGLVMVGAARLGLQAAVQAHPGVLEGYRREVAGVTMAAVLSLCLFTDPTNWRKPNPFNYFVVAGPLAVLSSTPALYFWGCAYKASCFQGVGHVLFYEPPTLPQLKGNVAYEYGHTTYFPCLVLQSVCDTFLGSFA